MGSAPPCSAGEAGATTRSRSPPSGLCWRRSRCSRSPSRSTAPRRPAPSASTERRSMKVALVHDYLTQRGGAERVVLSLTRAFPDAPLYTSLYDPAGTFPAFADVDVRPLPLNAIATLRHRHRLALPLLPPAFSPLAIPADL